MNQRIIIRIIVLAALLAAAFFAYRFFFVAGREAETPGVEALSSRESGGVPVDDEFLRLLVSLQGIELDANAVFNHPVWEGLENFRRELVPEERGRRNPFAPAGLDGSATSTAPVVE